MKVYATVAVLLLVGCGALRGSGSVGEREIILDGTGAAWLDETAYGIANDEVLLETRSPEQTVLNLFFSGAVFNPAERLQSLPAVERAATLDEIERADQLLIEIRRGDRIAAGDELVFDSEVGEVPRALPFVDRTTLALGENLNVTDTEYPDSIELLATGRRGALTFDEVEPRVSGTLRYEVFKAEFEEDRDRAEGVVEVFFNLELLPERVAECNFDRAGAGVLDACF